MTTPRVSSRLALRRLLGGFCLVTAAMFGGSAQANTITLSNAGTAFTACHTDECGTLTDGQDAAINFLGYYDNGSEVILSSDTATGFALDNSNPETEAAQLNLLAGTSFSTTNSDYPAGFNVATDTSGKPYSFNVPANAYFLAKIDGIDGGFFFFKNLDGPLTVTYTQTGTKAGLSHYAIFPVPLPPAALLFGSALVGLGGIARGRRKQQPTLAQPSI